MTVTLLARTPAAGLPSEAARLVLGVGWRRRRQRLAAASSLGTLPHGDAGDSSSDGSHTHWLLPLPSTAVGTLELSPGVAITAPPPPLHLAATADAAFGEAATVVVAAPTGAGRGWRAAAEGVGGEERTSATLATAVRAALGVALPATTAAAATSASDGGTDGDSVAGGPSAGRPPGGEGGGGTILHTARGRGGVWVEGPVGVVPPLPSPLSPPPTAAGDAATTDPWAAAAAAARRPGDGRPPPGVVVRLVHSHRLAVPVAAAAASSLGLSWALAPTGREVIAALRAAVDALRAEVAATTAVAGVTGSRGGSGSVRARPAVTAVLATAVTPTEEAEAYAAALDTAATTDEAVAAMYEAVEGLEGLA
ncbi:hypothetical protein MMPV_009340 [Pyropia vietnamensis]